MHISEFKAQEVATVWTFETPCQWDVKLFAALTRAAQLCISEFNAQGIAETGWAFAMLRQLGEELFAALARQAELRISGFKEQGIAHLTRPTRPGRSRCYSSWTSSCSQH